MPEHEEIDHVLKKMKVKYDKDPENWTVTGNQDKDGNREMFISQQPNTYWLKMKQINPYSHLALGTELTNIDNEINKKSPEQSKSIKSQQDLLNLFGLIVPSPSKKEVLYTTGIERFSPRLSNEMKTKIDEKNPNADQEFRKQIRKKWEKEYFDREGVYL